MSTLEIPFFMSGIRCQKPKERTDKISLPKLSKKERKRIKNSREKAK